MPATSSDDGQLATRRSKQLGPALLKVRRAQQLQGSPLLRTLDYFQLFVLAAWALFGVLRAFYLRQQGVRIIVADRTRSGLEMLCDAALAATLLSWLYLAVAYPCGLPTAAVPTWTDVRLFDSRALQTIGAVVMTVGVATYALGVFSMGSAWRMGIDHEDPGPLATGGIFAWTRNPIYVGIECLFVGVALIQGRAIFLLLTLLFASLVHCVIIREERFLKQQFGAAFTDYCAHVGRYVTPWR